MHYLELINEKIKLSILHLVETRISSFFVDGTSHVLNLERRKEPTKSNSRKNVIYNGNEFNF